MTVPLFEASWPVPPNVAMGSTTRQGGVSTGPYESLNLAMHVDDKQDHVMENRRRVHEACELPAEPRWLEQVHGNRVADALILDVEGQPPVADAAVSRRANEVLAVLTADCLPLLLCSQQGDEVAVAHCGWRGLAGGVVDKTIGAMETKPENLLAWLGPAISQSAFEVGNEVRDKFLGRVECAPACFKANDRGRWQADLFALARGYLAMAGVERIYGGDRCTYAEPERFFSFRRDGQCGRMASFVYMRS